VQFALIHAATAAAVQTTPAAATYLVMTSAISAANLTVGVYIPELKLPDQHLRYVGVGFIVATANLTGGIVSTWFDIARGMRHR
jgi:hypothetical protein